MILIILRMLITVVILYIIASQIVIPVINNRKIFPMFNKKRKSALKRIVDINEELDTIELEDESMRKLFNENRKNHQNN